MKKLMAVLVLIYIFIYKIFFIEILKTEIEFYFRVLLEFVCI